MNKKLTCDVAIIGGGPAGAAAGSQLAQAGKQVVLLERENFPRFCVGESLLPHGNQLLRDIGVWEKIEAAGFQRKYGAEFCTGDGTRIHRFWFERNLGPELAYSYQVERDRFDQILLNHAAEHGCQVHEGTAVSAFEETGDGKVRLECNGPHGRMEITSRWVVDSTGRSAFSGTRLGLRKRSTMQMRRVAIYGHFQGAFRNQGKAEGHITIIRTARGWFWLIPLSNGRTSVGLVLPVDQARTASGRSLEALFQEVVESTPEARDRLRHATQLTPLRATGDYSWKFSTFATKRVLFVGDAAGFVDPIFSSGVMLALKSSALAVPLLLQADEAGRGLTFWERHSYTRQVARCMKLYGRIISSFYDRAGFEVFMTPSPVLNIPGAIGRLVGGDTEPGLADKLRIDLFQLICRLQRYLPVVPSIPSLR